MENSYLPCDTTKTRNAEDSGTAEKTLYTNGHQGRRPVIMARSFVASEGACHSSVPAAAGRGAQVVGATLGLVRCLELRVELAELEAQRAILCKQLADAASELRALHLPRHGLRRGRGCTGALCGRAVRFKAPW